MLLFWLMACLKITYTTGPEVMREPDHDEWHHRFAQGMIEVPGPYDAGETCPNGVRQIQTEISVTNSLANAAAQQMGAAVGVDTSGVYTPSTIHVWCKRKE